MIRQVFMLFSGYSIHSAGRKPATFSPARRMAGLLCVIILCALFTVSNVMALPGDLDTGFGSGGIVTTDIGGNEDRIHALALQSDGKIVAAGMVDGTNGRDFALVRYHPDGSLDTGFGAGGIVTTDVDYEQAFAVAVQSDGKIVAAGDGSSPDGNYVTFMVTRYNSNGSLDTGFGTNGIVSTMVGAFDTKARALAIQSDGKILVGGMASPAFPRNDYTLARYTSNGSLDPNFDSDGIVTTSIKGYHDEIRSLAVQADGKIVACGRSVEEGLNKHFEFAVVRYNNNGSLDTGFSADGKVTTSISTGHDNAKAVAIQSDGKIVVAGEATAGPGIVLVRYNANGSLDTGFDTDGMVTTDIGPGYCYATSVAIQPDGKILTAGAYMNGNTFYQSLALVRYNPDGSLDTGFGVNGIVTTHVGSHTNDEAGSMVIRADKKILIGGYTETTSARNFCLARYLGDVNNSPVPYDFNSDGKSDILYRNSTNGKVGVWLMAGATEDAWALIGNHGTYWDARGVGDFNGDGSVDIVFRNNNGMVGVWLMNGANEDTWRLLGNHGTAWNVKGVGDFNNDGSVDVVYRNNSGSVGVWLMNGTTEDTWRLLGSHGTAWDVKGVGDFNDDGSVDVVYSSTSGMVGIWLMNGATEVTWVPVANHGTYWQPECVGDYNNDGKADIVYQNTNGTVGVWLMGGTTENTWQRIGNHGDWEVR